MINDNETITSTPLVRLTSSCLLATQMRFGNNTEQLSNAPWVDFSSGYLWTLAGTT
ncbi:MAG: hypothetical protein WCL02_03985 [bacterium]